MYAAAAPFWYVAGRRLRGILTSRMVPLIAIFSAFSFVIMMFNVPIPDGTTGHAVGATLMSIVLGPWAAVVGVSIALLVQAIFFGDGGILAFGANAVNMAVVMPFVGYVVYLALSGDAPLTSSRRVVAAAVAGYVALNAAALCTALELGIQPLLFHAADGTPLYAPFGLDKAVPAIMLAHLLIAGPVEGMVTGLTLAYLQRSNVGILQIRQRRRAAEVTT
jgi:cobalt/nickel transport system permease protein